MNEYTSQPASNLLTRRSLLAGTAATFFGLTHNPTPGAGAHQSTANSSPPNTTRTNLHQEVDLQSNPARVYAVLLDAKQFAAFSHEPADIQNDPGGAFSLFAARILGRNVELVPAQRIVQAWRSAGWSPGIFSIVRFEFKEQGAKTRVILDHAGFPEGQYDNLYLGWKSHYWEPLQLFFH
jgi:activator of HSP90 ATPase